MCRHLCGNSAPLAGPCLLFLKTPLSATATQETFVNTGPLLLVSSWMASATSDFQVTSPFLTEAKCVFLAHQINILICTDKHWRGFSFLYPLIKYPPFLLNLWDSNILFVLIFLASSAILTGSFPIPKGQPSSASWPLPLLYCPVVFISSPPP